MVPQKILFKPLILLVTSVFLISCGGPQKRDENTADDSGTLASSGTTLSEAEQEALRKSQEDQAADALNNNTAPVIPTAQAPRLSPTPGVTAEKVTVSLQTGTPEAQIFYTLDGSRPLPGKSKIYTEPLVITSTTLVRAVALLEGGSPSPMTQGDYTVGEIWVAPGAGGQGQRTDPFGSISQALALGVKLGIDQVKLRIGSFNESLVLTTGVNISGGYGANFSRSPGAFTQLKAQTMDGPGKNFPAYALKISSPSTAQVIIQGLDVTGAKADYAAALLVTSGAAPQFKDCRFTGGDGAYSYGAVVLEKSNPVFERSTFSGGTGDSNMGISIDTASATLYSSRISAGTGLVTGVGANVTAGSLRASGSIFIGGSANTNYALALYNTQGVNITGSTLWGGNGKDASALFVSVGSPVITGCVLSAGGTKSSYGIYANYGSSTPVVSYCGFGPTATGIFFDANTRKAYTQISPEGILSTLKNEPYSGAPALQSFSFSQDITPPDYFTPFSQDPRLVSGGPSPQTRALDLRGKTRTEPWSVGAYEQDQ